MTEFSPTRRCRAHHWSIVVLALCAFARGALADGDLPPQIVLQSFVKLEDGRAHLIVRVPLVLFAGFPLQKRGPGYIDLADAGPKLKQVAVATSHQVELSADGAILTPITRELQLSLLSDRSFSSYAAALSHLQGPPLPGDTELFWNQGFFDVHLEYQLQSPRPKISIRVNVAPELAQRIKLQLEYLPVGGPARSYEIPGDAGWIPLDPQWYDAAWLFVKTGFVDAFAIDRLVFLVCLIAPFRRLRGVLTMVMLFVALQALTLTATAEGVLADVEVGWLPLLANTVLATALVLLAIANLACPTLRRRWFIAAAVGTLGGFGLGGLLAGAWQFVGTHPLVAVVAFNVGTALGQAVWVIFAFYALRLLFAKLLGAVLGIVVLSALIGHAGWHGMLDSGGELGQQLQRWPSATLWSALSAIAPWLVPAALVGVVAYFLPKRFDGETIPSLRRALQGRNADMSSTRV